MRPSAILAVSALALVVAAPGSPAVAKSGIRGTVIESPTSPVCRVRIPCSAPAAGIVLVALRDGVRVATATTSSSGTYRLVLRPGIYVLRGIRTSMFGSLPPRTVRVAQGRLTVADFRVDTGIR